MTEPAMPMAKSGVLMARVAADLLFCSGVSGL